MRALRELIDYFLSRGSFTEEEIRMLRAKGYLEQDENNLIFETEVENFEAYSPEKAHKDVISAEKALAEKRSKGKVKAKKTNQLSASEFNHYLSEEFKKWKPELDSLLLLLSELNGQSRNFRSLSIGGINEDSLKPLLIQYLSSNPEFMKSLWWSISFDGYLELVGNKTGIGARIYKLICKGENLMNYVSYRFCLNYKYIKLFQCIVLLQRLVLKTLRFIFNENPGLVLSFLRKARDKEIINSFLLYDMVSHNLLEFNKIFCIFSGEPFRDESCMKFETSGKGDLFIWGLGRKIERLDLKNFSRTDVENVFCEPEFCINDEGSLLAFYRKPFENGTYRTVYKISFLKKNTRSSVWRRWKKFRVNETDPSVMLFHAKSQSIIIATSAGDFLQIEFSGKRRRLGEDLKGPVRYVFSPRGDIIFLAGQLHESIATNEVSAFTFPEFRKINSLPVNSNVTGLSISSDGNYVVVANDNSQLITWDLKNNKSYEFTENQDLIISLSFGCYDDVFASLSSDKVIRLWDIRSRKCFQDLDMKKFGVDSGKNNDVKGLKMVLLRDDLIYLDNSNGLFIFNLHIARQTHISGYNKHISKWTDYLGKYCWGRIDFDKKILFNAVTMDCGEKTETYNSLINDEVSTLIINKPAHK